MAKTAVLGGHTSSLRDGWWYLEQDDDGALFVSYENEDDHSADWRKPIAEVLADKTSSVAKMVQERINRMFESRDSDRT